jgi:glutamate--cysteine ligase
VKTITEQAAELLIADQAFAPGPPGFVGAAADLLLSAPGLPPTLAGSLRTERPPLRHGLLTARSSRVVVVSGPPSPGLAACVARLAEDMPMPLPLIAGHGVRVLDVAATDAAATDAAATDAAATDAVETAGIRVALEAGLDGGGPLGLAHRWTLAHLIAPVLAAAFANAPAGGWRSIRQADRRDLSVLPALGDPRAAWTAYVMDAPMDPAITAASVVAGTGAAGGTCVAPARAGTFRAWARTSQRPALAQLARHIDALRPPVAARGHLEMDVADRQPGAGWQVPVAVITVLLDDPQAATDAYVATAPLATEHRLWERAARDALTDPVLAAAARECFLIAYAALARQGLPRELRDAVADFTARYVLRGRCPADDVRVTA